MAYMFWQWMASAFDQLPGCTDDLFKQLWVQRRLLHADREVDTNLFDEYTARLVCAAIRRRQSLHILLPDQQPQRPALALASALLRTWEDLRQSASPDSKAPVVYFGATVGIRDQLGKVSVKGLSLRFSDVFRQVDLVSYGNQLHNSKYKQSSGVTTSLPQVITVFAPADPANLLRQYRPQWVAVDCGTEPQLDWLDALLQEAQRQRICVLSWSQNPMTEYKDQFNDSGLVFSWPLLPDKKYRSHLAKFDDLKSLMMPALMSNVVPIVLEGSNVDRLSSLFNEARRRLLTLGNGCHTGFVSEAVRIHWRYLGMLEGLVVPLETLESEIDNLWGVSHPEAIRATCDKFRSELAHGQPHSAAELDLVASLLDEVVQELRLSPPPLWKALCNLCIEEPAKGEGRVLVFRRQAHKRLFDYALLAHFNICQDDLHSLRIDTSYLDEFRTRPSQASTSVPFQGHTDFHFSAGFKVRPTIAGMPNDADAHKLSSLFDFDTIDLIVYPHQLISTERRVLVWNHSVQPNLKQAAFTVAKLSNPQQARIPLPPPTNQPRVVIDKHTSMDVTTAKRGVREIRPGPWLTTDPVTEAKWLLSDDIFDVQVGERSADDISDNNSPEDWVDSAIVVSFSGHWIGKFAPDEQIRLITRAVGKVQLVKRYVRSLRVGDRVLMIHGQRRQDLYELIISRVHRHSGIAIHIAMIRKWQADFHAGFVRCRAQLGLGLDDLLDGMRKRGSKLVSTTTLRQWLHGNTLCPEAQEDVVRAADVLDLSFVKENYVQIYRAASRIRGLHRGLSNKLNRWLEEQASGVVTRGDDEIIDNELGLTFGDFRDSLLVLTVESITDAKGPFLRASLGNLDRRAK